MKQFVLICSLGNSVAIRCFLIALCSYQKRCIDEINNNVGQNLLKEIATLKIFLCENHILKLPPKQTALALEKKKYITVKNASQINCYSLGTLLKRLVCKRMLMRVGLIAINLTIVGKTKRKVG